MDSPYNGGENAQSRYLMPPSKISEPEMDYISLSCLKEPNNLIPNVTIYCQGCWLFFV